MKITIIDGKQSHRHCTKCGQYRLRQFFNDGKKHQCISCQSKRYYGDLSKLKDHQEPLLELRNHSKNVINLCKHYNSNDHAAAKWARTPDEKVIRRLKPIVKYFNKHVPYAIKQYQFDALCWLAFDMGLINFQIHYGINKLLNKGIFTIIPDQIMRLTNSDPHHCKLAYVRLAQANMFAGMKNYLDT